MLIFIQPLVSLLLFLGIIKGSADLPSHTVWPALLKLSFASLIMGLHLTLDFVQSAR
jgi:hypothetical protein